MCEQPAHAVRLHPVKGPSASSGAGGPVFLVRVSGRGFVRVLWAGNAKPLKDRDLAIFANARFGLPGVNSLHHKRFHFACGVGVPQVACKTQNIERPRR